MRAMLARSRPLQQKNTVPGALLGTTREIPTIAPRFAHVLCASAIGARPAAGRIDAPFGGAGAIAPRTEFL
jgi:hypothetical protein